MKTQSLLMIVLLLLGYMIPVNGQEEIHALNFSISVNEHVRPSFKTQGRLFITLSTTKEAEPKDQIWPNSIRGRHYLFAKNFSAWNVNEPLVIQDTAGWSAWGRTGKCSLNAIPEDTYYIQLLWQQYFYGFGNKEEGNIFSKKQELVLDKTQTIEISLSEVVEGSGLMDHPLMKMVHFKSDTLSKWWRRPIYERAAVLLPSGYYDNPGREYPIYYYVGGGDSNCKRTLNMRWNRFSDSEWWMSEKAPQVIIVFLDGTINSNIYHLDSDNLGPHGHSLIYEFIPHIEKMYRGTDTPDKRYIGGCSTGGYGSLALQLFYPEAFNGVYCYSPDPITFGRLMNVNIYRDANYFYDQYGYQRLLKEPGTSRVPISWKDWLEFENVMGYSGTYLDSDHWFGVMSAISGPRGADGKPVPLVDPVTGEIDPTVAESWSRYDLRKYVASHWEEIGPKLKNKIYICTEATDNYNLNLAVQFFEQRIKKLDNPTPDIVIEYPVGRGHCSLYNMNFRDILYNIELNGKPGEMSKIKGKWTH